MGSSGNDSLLSIIHEARVRFQYLEYSESNIEGSGIIMIDAEFNINRKVLWRYPVN
jgi:hypothetical protein